MGGFKKGEVEATQLIGVILAIVAFLVVVGFVWSLNYNEYSEEELCHLSVLTRATSPDIVQSKVGLKCATNKICLTYGKGRCDEVFAGEQVHVVKIPTPASASDYDGIQLAARLIEQESAHALYSCWKTMGEGKLDLFARAGEQLGWEQTSTTCVICSRVAVDKSVDPFVLNAVNINEYMRTRQVPGREVTYLQAFTDASFNTYAKANEEAILGTFDHTKEEIIGHDGGEINREMTVIFMQAKPKKVGDVLRNMGLAGGTVAGATFMTPIVSNVAKRVVLTPLGAVVTVAGAAAIGGYGWYNARQGQLAAAGYCGPFTSNTGKAEEGCSLVQGINYNIADVNTLCARLEGNP